jgi:hypothetical protein
VQGPDHRDLVKNGASGPAGSCDRFILSLMGQLVLQENHRCKA